jgi:hypothetical protein
MAQGASGVNLKCVTQKIQPNLPCQKWLQSDKKICIEPVNQINSVADPGCLSLARLLTSFHLGSRKQQKRGGRKKLVGLPFFCSHKFHKVK